MLRGSPYYTLEVSTSKHLGIDVTTIDSICVSLSDSESDFGSCTADMQAITTLYVSSVNYTLLKNYNCSLYFATCYFTLLTNFHGKFSCLNGNHYKLETQDYEMNTNLGRWTILNFFPSKNCYLYIKF